MSKTKMIKSETDHQRIPIIKSWNRLYGLILLIQVFLMPHEDFTYLNSTIVREVASFGGDISSFVTPYVDQVLRNKFAK